MYTWAVKNQKKNEEEKAHWRNFLLSYLVIKKKACVSEIFPKMYTCDVKKGRMR